MLWEIIALILVLTLAVALAGLMYESKCRIKQWSARYFRVKARNSSLLKVNDKLRFRLQEKEAIIAELEAKLKTSKERHKRLQKRACEKDIDNQKVGVNQDDR